MLVINESIIAARPISLRDDEGITDLWLDVWLPGDWDEFRGNSGKGNSTRGAEESCHRSFNKATSERAMPGSVTCCRIRQEGKSSFAPK
jgi:hypothetical protein